MAAFHPCESPCPQTVDLGGFIAAFGIWQKVAMKLRTLVVSWPLSSNCRPWQFYCRFWDMKERDIKFDNLWLNILFGLIFWSCLVSFLLVRGSDSFHFVTRYLFIKECSLSPWPLPTQGVLTHTSILINLTWMTWKIHVAQFGTAYVSVPRD